jgi:Skp family chaperone for outer membrane proteins
MYLRHVAAATVVALIALVSALPAAAQQSGILTIDLARAQAETEVGQDIQRQLEELEAQFRDNLQSGGQDLQSSLQELQQQHEQFIITDEVYEQRMVELQQQDQQLRARYEVSNQAVQYARGRALEAFFQTILPDIEAVMDARNGDALIEIRSLVASSQDIDITDDVVSRVNGRITELEVQLLPQRQEGEGDN